MAKISALPPLADNEVTGDELAPVVKDGVSRRASLNALAQPAVNQAGAYAATAEAVVGPNYPDTATGLAATVNGESFAVSIGGDIVDIYRNNGGVAVLQRSVTTPAALASNVSGKGAAMIGAEGGGTVQDALDRAAPHYWRKLPTLEAHVTAGTPTANGVRMNVQAAALEAMGGGILRMVEDDVPTDRPLIMRQGVSFEGPGDTLCRLRNVRTETVGYSAAQSGCILPGNLHPAYTQNLYGHAASKAIGAAISGDGAVTLTNSADAALFPTGHTIILLSNEYYAAGGGNIAYYMTVRKVLSSSAVTGIIYLDEPLWDALPTGGIIHNLTTTAVPGGDYLDGGAGLPLFVWGDGEIAGISFDTVGNALGPANAAYKGRILDCDITSWRTWYVNSFVHSVMDGVHGHFALKAGETSLNSENFEVRNAHASYSPELAARTAAAGVSLVGQPAGGISSQENSLHIRWVNLVLNLTGSPAGAAMIVNNATDVLFDRVRASKFNPENVSDVVAIGNLAVAANRREALRAKIRGVEWDGYCGRYLSMVNAATAGASIDMRARGPVSGTNGVVITDCQGRNVIEPTSSFENGRLDFAGTAANVEAIGCYVGGGLAALTTGVFTELETNNVRDIRTANSAARRAMTTGIPAEVIHTGTTANTTILSKNMGASLQPQDVFHLQARVNVTGTAGIKSLYLRLRNETDGVDATLASFTIPAATTGVITLDARARAVRLDRVLATLTRCSNGTVTIFEGGSTVNLTGKVLSLRLDVALVNAADTVAVQALDFGLRNEVQN